MPITDRSHVRQKKVGKHSPLPRVHQLLKVNQNIEAELASYDCFQMKIFVIHRSVNLHLSVIFFFKIPKNMKVSQWPLDRSDQREIAIATAIATLIEDLSVDLQRRYGKALLVIKSETVKWSWVQITECIHLIQQRFDQLPWVRC